MKYKLLWLTKMCLVCYQEELLQRKDIEQDASMLPAVEVPSVPSPASQVSDQKLDESKREAAEED